VRSLSFRAFDGAGFKILDAFEGSTSGAGDRKTARSSHAKSVCSTSRLARNAIIACERMARMISLGVAAFAEIWRWRMLAIAAWSRWASAIVEVGGARPKPQLFRRRQLRAYGRTRCRRPACVWRRLSDW